MISSIYHNLIDLCVILCSMLYLYSIPMKTKCAMYSCQMLQKFIKQNQIQCTHAIVVLLQNL